jgi:2-succinyl-5-enolpyruvyl-6-hydroxy-3-cyclohexene-1-carboxylate synthase
VNGSTALATVVVRSMADLGVRHVVLCPGSRSSPLAYALADAQAAGLLEVHVRIDERSAGFLALGLAKERGRPAMVVTTSGTAVANLHPAVLEAAHAGVPLVVVSADRPHELRGTGANQTTDQVRLFGPAVRWFGEIPAPDGARAGMAAAWRNVLARAFAAAYGTLSADPGPVHLNVCFREPLLPDLPGEGDAWPEPLDGVRGLTRVEAPQIAAPVLIWPGPRTVVLAGDGAGVGARRLAERAGWPLLAEPSSAARAGANAVGPYRLLLDHPRLGGRIERVLVFGRPTLSRPVSRLLARDDVEVVVVSRRPDWTDAAGRAARVLPAVDVEPAARDDDDDGDAGGGGWLATWTAAGTAARAAIDAVLDDEAAAGRLTGPLVAREAAAALGPGQALVAGSSNPIRDLDLAMQPQLSVEPDAELVVLANRGLSGIDGTLATASGVALARGRKGPLPVRALVGDLTFLHDLGGLLVGPLERRPQVQVVVVDDAGGGLFGLLEPGERALLGPAEAATFERVFATPHGAGLADLCAGMDAAYTAVKDLASLRAALGRPAPGTSVLHVQVDRAAQRALAAALSDEVNVTLA